MPGIPLLNIGAALGGLSQGWNQAQNQGLQQALARLQLNQQQRQQQAQALAFQALSNGVDTQPLSPLTSPPIGPQPSAQPAVFSPQFPSGSPGPQINVMPPMQQASAPTYSDSNDDTSTTPPPPTLPYVPGQPPPPGYSFATGMNPDGTYATATTEAEVRSPTWKARWVRNDLPNQQSGTPLESGVATPGTPPSGASGQATGNLVPGGALSLGSVLDTIERDESGGRNILQTAYSGAPGSVNPSTGTHTPPSTASGLYQITNQTWRAWAPRVGVDLTQYPTAMSAPPDVQRKVAAYGLQSEGVGPWAPYNPKLARDLGQSYSTLPRPGQATLRDIHGQTQMPAPFFQETSSVAQQAGNDLVSQGAQYSFRSSVSDAARTIQKVAPDADPAVKFMALTEMNKLMAPDQKWMLSLLLQQNKNDLQEQMLNYRSQMQQQLLDQRQQFSQQELNQRQSMQGWQIGSVDAPDPQHPGQTMKVPVRMNTATGEVQPLQLPGGATNLTRLPSASQGGALPPGWTDSQLDFWANVVRNGGQLPPGIARTAGGSAIVQAIMNRIPGAAGGDAGAFIANHSTVKADSSSLVSMTKMTDAATSFEQTANKNFDLALSLSKDAVPTDAGPWLNKWVETGQTQFGDEQVPAYTTALLTAANEYAKIMSGSTGGQGSTVDARREAAERFSPYLNAGQIAQVVAVAKTDMENRKQSLYGQVDEIKTRLKTSGSNQPTAQQGGQSPAASPQAPSGPAVGQVQGGYRFKGGDPADQNNWERVQ